ncbi:MAG: T9SS type A sorting domain-containing protein [Dysgonamonadaceae bacterium]|jgi:hypothetical protein|nr:T9SS type A sorting domain-containing protein [Dysgonamonadaceae bacterium]
MKIKSIVSSLLSIICSLGIFAQSGEIPGDISYRVQVEKTSEWIYWATVTLTSNGAESFQVITRDWDAGMSVIQNFSTPQCLTFNTMYLTYGSPIRFTFKAINQFGEKQVVYNMPPVSYYDTEQYFIAGESPDGKIIKEDSVLVLDESYTFSVRNVNGYAVSPKSCNWSFAGLTNDSIFIPVFTASAGSEYNIEINKEPAVDMTRFASLKRYRFEGDSSVYFRARIACEIISSENQKIATALPVFLNVLPGMPEIELLGIEDVESEDPDIYYRKDFSFRFHADRATNLYCTVWMYDEESFKMSGITYPLMEEYFSHPFYFYSEDPDSCTFMMTAHNQFGRTESAEISINDLLASSSSSSVKKISDNSIRIYPNPVKDFLYIDGNLQAIASIAVINAVGETVYRDINAEGASINLSGIPSGVYLIQFKYTGNTKSDTFKFVKY